MLKSLKIYKFLDQVKQEAKKVVWPEKKELISLLVLVFLSVFISSMVVLLADYIIHNLVQFMLNLGR